MNKAINLICSPTQIKPIRLGSHVENAGKQIYGNIQRLRHRYKELKMTLHCHSGSNDSWESFGITKLSQSKSNDKLTKPLLSFLALGWVNPRVVFCPSLLVVLWCGTMVLGVTMCHVAPLCHAFYWRCQCRPPAIYRARVFLSLILLAMSHPPRRCRAAWPRPSGAAGYHDSARKLRPGISRGSQLTVSF